MSLTPAPKVTLLNLPASWWGCFFQHVAATSDAVRSVAVLSSTCKTLLTFSEELEYSYQEIIVSCSTSIEPFWQWLAKQKRHVPSLTARIQPFPDAPFSDPAIELQAKAWEQPFWLLSAIPKLQLTVRVPNTTYTARQDFMKQWLQEYAAFIDEMIAECVGENEYGWPSLKALVGLVHPQCKSLTVRCNGTPHTCGPLASLTGLTSLELSLHSFTRDSPWACLAALTGLQKLQCHFVPSHNPSPLSALTSLTSLHLARLVPKWQAGLFAQPVPLSFSSLQPLSTLQQLEVLKLEQGICTATSLQGLAGLMNLQKVHICCKELESLQGLSPSVTSLRLHSARGLGSFAGIENAASLQELDVFYGGLASLQGLATLSKLRAVSISSPSLLGGDDSSTLEVFQESSSCLRSLSITDACCLGSVQGAEKLTVLEELTLHFCVGITSLKPLGGLGSQLKKLHVEHCSRVVEEVLELPHIQPTADVVVARSNVREVVLAGGISRFV